MASPLGLLIDAQPPAPSGVFAGVAVIITTLTGLVVAATSLIKAIRRSRTPKNDVEPEEDDIGHAERAWRETLEQLDAAGERADRAEKDARYWRNKYVKLLEEGRQ